jgi:hypothetical protein
VNIGVATEPPFRRDALWEAPKQRRNRRAGWTIVLGSVVLVGTLGIAALHRIDAMFSDYTPSMSVGWKVKTLATEDFPRWQKVHPDERCPARLSELDDIDTLDPWGHALQYTCDPRLLRAASPGIAITSAGEDGTFGTADDIGSDP